MSAARYDGGLTCGDGVADLEQADRFIEIVVADKLIGQHCRTDSRAAHGPCGGETEHFHGDLRFKVGGCTQFVKPLPHFLRTGHGDKGELTAVGNVDLGEIPFFGRLKIPTTGVLQ